MSFFLKQTNNKKGTYLQIYESYYDPIRRGGAHRSIKPIGYIHELIASGIKDSVSYFQKEVDALAHQTADLKSKEKQKRNL